MTSIRVLSKASPMTANGVPVAINQQQLPSSWMTSTYAPGFPITPFVSPKETETPREIDYPISVNASLQPRTGYGLMSFADLKTVYEMMTEVRMPVQMSIRQLTGFLPHLVDDEGNEADDDHPYQWLCVSPDRESPFDVWLTRFMKSSDIFDAGCFYIQQDGDDVKALRYLDGSTMFIIIDEKGRVPQPKAFDPSVTKRQSYVEKLMKFNRANPGYLKSRMTKSDDGEAMVLTPAFAQVIKGTPFAWYTADEIWYKPRSRRYDAPYGETFIEQAFSWIMIIANITGFELAHYREGNMPEGWWETPDGWSLDRIEAFELSNNLRMSSGPAERMRGRFYPKGMIWHETKKADFPKELYQRAFNNLVMTFGYPPSEFGEMTGKGLGGKDLGDLLQDKSFRDAIVPRKTYIEGALNNVLQKAGVDDAHIELQIPKISSDPDKEREAIYDGVAHGVYTPNDALGQLGFDPMEGSFVDGGEGEPIPIPGHIGNKHLIIAGSTIYILEDLKDTNGVALPSASPQKEPATQQDFAQQRETAKELLMTGKTPGSKTYSLPSLQFNEDEEGDSAELSEPLDESVVKRAELQKNPYEVRGTTVVNSETGEPVPGGEHDTAEQAEAHMRALYSKVPDAEKIGRPHHEAPHDMHPEAHEIMADTLAERMNEQGIPITNAGQAERNHGSSAAEKQGEPVPPGVDANEFAMGMKEEQEHAATVDGDQSKIRSIVLDHLREDSKYYSHLFGKSIRLTKQDLRKHCGVCEEDDEYFGAPIAREVVFDFPSDDHVNDVEIVAMQPEGLPPKPALWKPEGGELEGLRQSVGGALYPREEAAYLLDRSLGFYLVPVAYVAECNGEMGAALYYSVGSQGSKDATEYDPQWIERAAVLDYIERQLDRNSGNWLTHPDDPQRPLIIDNGLSFPNDPSAQAYSPFCAAMVDKPLSNEALAAIKQCIGDAATWKDITDLVGAQAAEIARACAVKLLQEGKINDPQGAIITGSTQNPSMQEKAAGEGDSETFVPGFGFNDHS